MKRKYEAIGAVLLAAISLTLTFMIVQANGKLLWDAAGVSISGATGYQQYPRMVSDGASGAIIAWQDTRSGGSPDIYAQHVLPNGQVAWTTDGVLISGAANDQQYPALTSDGQNGAIIVWQDRRGGSDFDIFAQRISAGGTPLWTTDGITICALSGDQDMAAIVSDGQGGAVIVWEDRRSSSQWDVYVQRINVNGNTLWAANGVKVTGAFVGNRRSRPAMASDGASGALIAWMNETSGSGSDILAQRVLSNGTAAWATGGISLTANGHSLFPRIINDGTGGAIVAWELGGIGIASQRVRANGTPAWSTSGITLSTQSGTGYAQLVNDGSQGAFVSWYHAENGTTSSVVAQRVLSNSVQVWASGGITISSVPGFQNPVALIGDGFNGIIAVWLTDLSGSYSVWAQRVSADGALRWTTEGLLIRANSAAEQWSAAAAAVGDMGHGVIVVWEDLRNGMEWDLYAQRISDFIATAWVYLPLVRK